MWTGHYNVQSLRESELTMSAVKILESRNGYQEGIPSHWDLPRLRVVLLDEGRNAVLGQEYFGLS